MSAPNLTADAVALEPISLPESRDLIALEKRIEKGLQTFLEVGQALIEIRDRKLYRLEHSTFESYCRVKWGMSQQWATQLCRSASAVLELKSETVVSLPQTERQARPLTRLDTPTEKAAAWNEAAALAPNNQPTAKSVANVVEVKLELVGKKEGPACYAGRKPPETEWELEDRVDRYLETLINRFPPAIHETVRAIVFKSVTSDQQRVSLNPQEELIKSWMRMTDEQRRQFLSDARTLHPNLFRK